MDVNAVPTKPPGFLLVHYKPAARRHLPGGVDDDIQDEGIHFSIYARRVF